MAGVEALARRTGPGREGGPTDGSPGPGVPTEIAPGRPEDRLLERAARRLRAWTGEGAPAWVAVAVTPGWLRAGEPVGRLEELAAREGVDPARLVLTISERAATPGLEGLAPRLRELRALGTRVALVDYGAGSTRAARLGELPVDLIGVDPSLLAPAGARRARRDLAEPLVRFGIRLGLEVLVEGIDTGAGVAWAAEVGSDLVGGEAAGGPVPAGEL